MYKKFKFIYKESDLIREGNKKNKPELHSPDLLNSIK